MRIIAALFFCAVLTQAQTKLKPRPIPVIFDTDIGDDIDDALALALALQSPELDVKLITTVVDDVESRTRLAWKELGFYGRQDIPIATGAPEPLLDPRVPDLASQFTVLTAQDRPPASSRARAADRIIETLMQSPVKMTLIPVGPLTNIALALKEEPRIKDKIERIVLMGGAYYPAKREYNIYRDRIAAEIVFRSGVPIVGVGLDVTRQCKLQEADLAKLRNAGNPAAQFLSQLIELWRKDNKNGYPTLHDPLAVGAVIRASLLGTETGTVQVDTVNPKSFGTTLFTASRDANAKTKVARTVNAQEFLTLFIDRVSAPPRGK